MDTSRYFLELIILGENEAFLIHCISSCENDSSCEVQCVDEFKCQVSLPCIVHRDPTLDPVDSCSHVTPLSLARVWPAISPDRK